MTTGRDYVIGLVAKLDADVERLTAERDHLRRETTILAGIATVAMLAAVIFGAGAFFHSAHDDVDADACATEHPNR